MFENAGPTDDCKLFGSKAIKATAKMADDILVTPNERAQYVLAFLKATSQFVVQRILVSVISGCGQLSA